MMLARLCSTVFRIKSRQRFLSREIQMSCTFNSVQSSNSVLQSPAVYSTKMEEHILKIINETDARSLSRYNITKKNAEILVSHRNNCGPYKSLNDVLQIGKIDSEILEEFYKSLLTKEKKARTLKGKKNTLATTRIPDALKNCKTILGIHIGCNSIGWALLDNNYTLLHWDCERMTEKADPRVLYSVREILQIFQKVPVSDLYVMEEVGTHLYVKNNFSCLTQQQISAIFMTCIALRNDQSLDSLPKNNLFMLRYNIVPRYFGLLIGNEVVSSEHIVEMMCNNRMDRNEGDIQIHVNIPNNIRNLYTQKFVSDKECMNRALLNVAAFLHVDVQKNYWQVNKN